MNRTAKITKTLAYVIPAAVIILFLAVTASGGYIKANSKAGKKIMHTMVDLEALIKSESWEEAIAARSALEAHWQEVVPLLQLSASIEAVQDFSRTLKSLEGYLEAKERGLSLAEAAVLRILWDELDS